MNGIAFEHDWSTPWTDTVSATIDPLDALVDGYEAVRYGDVVMPPQFLPFRIWELGLGELSPYVPGLYQLIEQGVRWQRIRGTPASVAMGLNWIGYAGTLEYAQHWRNHWNQTQIHLARIRDADIPDLKRISGIINLSLPFRSDFHRGFRDYDVRAVESDGSRLDGTMLDDHSGVRVAGVDAARSGLSPTWSFGRSHQVDLSLSQAALTALGVWMPQVGTSELWNDGTYLWHEADFLWNEPLFAARQKAIATAIADKSVYLRFRKGDGTIIGHRRCVIHPVKPVGTGHYQVGTGHWSVDEDAPEAIIVTGRTGFGDGAGATATSMSLVFDAARATGVKPGALWIGPTGLTGGTEVASTTVNIPFGLTVREACTYLLRF